MVIHYFLYYWHEKLLIISIEFLALGIQTLRQFINQKEDFLFSNFKIENRSLSHDDKKELLKKAEEIASRFYQNEQSCENGTSQKEEKANAFSILENLQSGGMEFQEVISTLSEHDDSHSEGQKEPESKTSEDEFIKFGNQIIYLINPSPKTNQSCISKSTNSAFSGYFCPVEFDFDYANWSSTNKSNYDTLKTIHKDLQDDEQNFNPERLSKFKSVISGFADEISQRLSQLNPFQLHPDFAKYIAAIFCRENKHLKSLFEVYTSNSDADEDFGYYTIIVS